MANIELVIKIPEEEYEMIVNSEDCGLHTLTRVIAHGTLLPKGHGRLVNISPYEQKEKNATPWELRRHVGRHIIFPETKSLSELPTIIPADNERDGKE